MRFKINGASPILRGANMIPMEELEGRQSSEAYELMMKSAVAAHMNGVRIWGGGIFLPDAFYDACDRLGVVVALHDVMYGTPWNGGNESIPIPNEDQKQEIRHAIRRLSSHPSILAWNGRCFLFSFFISPVLKSRHFFFLFLSFKMALIILCCYSHIICLVQVGMSGTSDYLLPNLNSLFYQPSPPRILHVLFGPHLRQLVFSLAFSP
jgi:hypothetical protein